jgi:hypothetical protein
MLFEKGTAAFPTHLRNPLRDATAPATWLPAPPSSSASIGGDTRFDSLRSEGFEGEVVYSAAPLKTGESTAAAPLRKLSFRRDFSQSGGREHTVSSDFGWYDLHIDDEEEEQGDGHEMPVDQLHTVEFITRWHGAEKHSETARAKALALPTESAEQIAAVQRRVLILNYIVSTRCFGGRCDDDDMPSPSRKLSATPEQTSLLLKLGLQAEHKTGADAIVCFAW